MTPYDPAFTRPDEDAEDLMDYDEIDQAEAHDAMWLRTLVTGLPARPGVVR